MENKLIIGLGNPGVKYKKTRHNIGFLTVDHIIDKYEFSLKKQGNAFIYSKMIFGSNIYIMKPMTYMNLSGEPVKKFVNYYKISNENILVIHDDVEIQPGTLRIKYNSGHGGHNGIRSIIENICTKEFYRVKMGIGRDPLYELHNWVLSKFSEQELKEIEKLFINVSEIIRYFFENSDLNKMMNKFNKKNAPKNRLPV